ncbi:MAG: exodeoxyribonuclease VII small subunit [Nocardioides sp.]
MPAEKVTTTSDGGPDDKPGEKPDYEQAREELIDVVRRLETGGASLEASLALWERGEALATICQEWLDGARARLDAVVAEKPD